MGDHHHYKIRDYQFGFQVLQLRERANLTQTQIATTLKISERAIQHWEGGSSRPTPANLRKLIALYLTHGAFTTGQEFDEAQAFWKQGCLGTSHHSLAFDENWFTTLLHEQDNAEHAAVPKTVTRTVSTQPQEELSSQGAASEQAISPSRTLSPLYTQDWGEAIDISTFYGREQELAELESWIIKAKCRLITLLGMGGMGKTMLSVKIAHQVASHFDFVLWRSLRNAPPFEELITDCIQFLSKQQHTHLPQSNEKCITQLIELLSEKRCLVVFDNIDALLQGGDLQGHYREDYEAYGTLIQRIAGASHQSCLLLTSREMLDGLSILEGRDAPVRTLKLAGLGHVASQQMLKDKELFGEQEAWSLLVKHYGGNPLALKIVAESVHELFGGDIAAFLLEGYVLFYDILLLLNHQFERLSALEQELMYWLAIERDPVSLEELSADLIYAPSKRVLLEALQSLRRRCLIERREREAIFTLQPVVLAYVTERLVGQVTKEIKQGCFTALVKYALMKGQAKDYLRQSQMRLLLQPTLKRLVAHFNSASELEQHLISLLEPLRALPRSAQGYAGGNIVNLLVQLRGHIRGIDFSHLLIQQAYLQGIEAQDTSFAGADLTNSVFMETFDSIAAVALSQDGKYLAVGSFNGQICVWQVADGQLLLTLKGHSRMVWSVAFSPDSTLLASGSYDRTVKLWDVASGHCVKTLEGHSEWVREVKFHPAGHLLASCADDKTIRIWHVVDGTCLRVFRGHQDAIWSLAFHPDRNTLVSGSNDKTLKLWDIASGDCLATLHTHAEEIFAVAISHDGAIIASSGQGGVRLWDTKSQEQFRTLPSGKDWVWSLAFTPEGTLARGGDDGDVTLWDVSSGQCLRTLQDHYSHNQRVWSIALATGNLLASGSHDGRVKLWNITNGYCLRIFQGYNQMICSLAFSPDGRLLVSGDDHSIIRIWDVSTGQCLNTLHGHTSRVWSLVFSPDGKTFASGENNRCIKVWDVLSGQCLKTLHGHNGVIWSLVFSPNGTILASGSLDRSIKLWDIREPGNEICIRTLHGSNWIWSLAFSPAGDTLASGNAEGLVTLWEVCTGTRLNLLHSGNSPIGAIAFRPDGKTLVSSSNDEKLRIWDVESGSCLRTVSGVGNTNWVKSVAFSSDAAMLATGCKDTTIKLCNVDIEHETRVLPKQEARVWSAAFSPDGSILASGSDDGTIILWSTQTGERRTLLHSDRPFERMNITGATGLTLAQKDALEVLGANDTVIDSQTETSH